MNKTFNVLWGPQSGEGGSGESDNAWLEAEGRAWKLKFAQLNKVRRCGCGCACVLGGEGVSVVVLYSASSRPREKRRRSNGGGGCECDRLGSQCCCVPVLHSVGTEMLLSDANELSVTSFSLLQMSICLARVDPAQTTSGQWRNC